MQISQEPPIFGKGIRQAIYWAYSMAGISPHERTAHCKLMMEVQDGYIEDFSLSGIDLRGLSEVEKFGEAANIRGITEKSVSEDQKHYIWAKYAYYQQPEKMLGMLYVVRKLTITGKCSRSRMADMVWHIVCTDRQRETCTVEKISRLHDVSESTVDRGVRFIKGVFRRVESDAFEILRPIFINGGII